VLDGIVYLHSLNNPRMTYSTKAGLRVFRKLCGGDAYNRVVLGTTFWDAVPPATAEAREAQLCQDFWSDMMQKGSPVIRVQRDRESGLRAIQMIERKWTEEGMSLKLWSEMRIGSTQPKPLAETSAFQQAVADAQGSATAARQQELARQWQDAVRRERAERRRDADAFEGYRAAEMREHKEQLERLKKITAENDEEAKDFARSALSWRRQEEWDMRQSLGILVDGCPSPTRRGWGRLGFRPDSPSG